MAESLQEKLSLTHLLGTEYHPLQPKLILAKEFEVAAVGGMGAGKSYAACIGALRHAAKWPGASVLIARLTYDEMVNSTKKLFFEIVKTKGLTSLFTRPKVWDYREGTHLARLTNGSEIRFSNLDKGVDKHKNFEYTYVFIDQLEEIEFEVYTIISLRCRSTACPPEERHVIGVANDEGDNWIRHRFLTYEQPHGLPHPKLGRLLVRGSSLENPHLDDATKASYLALPPGLRDRWVFAPMDAGSARLLPKLEVIEAFPIPRHWPRWLGVDPARSEGVTCGEFLTINPDKIAYHGVEPQAIHFYDEYWDEHRDVEDHAKDMNALIGTNKFQALTMDQTAWITAVKSKKTGTISVGDLYVKAGLGVSPSMGDEWTRVMLFIEAAKRGLTVSKKCAHLLEQAPKYRIKGQMGAFGQPLKIVSKARFHSVDAGGYALGLIPTHAKGVEIRAVRDAIDIAPNMDEPSRRHWEQENEHLPKRRGRESLQTVGFDEVEMFREDATIDPHSWGRPVEDELW